MARWFWGATLIKDFVLNNLTAKVHRAESWTHSSPPSARAFSIWAALMATSALAPSDILLHCTIYEINKLIVTRGMS